MIAPANRACSKVMLIVALLFPLSRLYAADADGTAAKQADLKGTQVSVVARLVSTPAALLKEQHFKLEEMFTVKKTGEKIVGRFMDDQQITDLILAIQKTENGTVMTVPRMTLFDGQKGSTVVAQQQAYVSGWTEPKDGQKRQAKIDTAQTGVFLDVTASVSTDQKYITLAMNARASQLMDLEKIIWDKAPQEKLTVQKPVMQLSEINTVISVPDDGTIALVLDRKDDLKEGRERVLLLLLSPTIIGAKAP